MDRTIMASLILIGIIGLIYAYCVIPLYIKYLKTRPPRRSIKQQFKDLNDSMFEMHKKLNPQYYTEEAISNNNENN